MASCRRSWLAHALTAALTLALAFAGIGQGAVAPADGAAAGYTVAGITVPICHTDAGDADRPSDPATHHTCCDACALLASAILPGAPAVPSRLTAIEAVDETGVRAAPPPGERRRTPRQAQAPPAS